MKTFLAVDMSECAEAVVQAACEQLSPERHQLHVFHAVDWETHLSVAAHFAQGPSAATYLLAERASMVRAAQSHVDSLAEHLRAAGFDVTTEVRPEGPAAATIVEAAATWGAALILVGAHRKSRLDRLLLGSVSAYVVHHATCSVQVVRPHDVATEMVA